MTLRKLLFILAFLPTIFAGAANASLINVLWVSGTTTYNTNISALGDGQAQDVSTYDPDSNGSLSWDIDFWSAGSVTFSDYDVLVIGSSCFGGTGSNCNNTSGFFGLGVLPQNNVLLFENEISTARGNRTFVSGQDADWHFMNDAADSADARAFLINAVNWAASGTGLGIVALTDGHTSGGAGNIGWLSHDDSFLSSELSGARNAGDSETVIIPASSASFPINEGLTSASLSNWGTSSHTFFEKSELDSNEWLSINDYAVLDGDNAVTIVTASQASGGTTGSNDIPEPASLAILSLGVMLLLARRQLHISG